jgi:hypothetical protein
MAHFAKINTDDTVEQVIVVNNEVLLDENGIEQEALGVQFCVDLFGGEWVQTSYNGNFRGLYAGMGMIYDKENDEFIVSVTE